MLRKVYHGAFSLIGVVCQEEERTQRIMNKYSDAGREKAEDFMKRDAEAVEEYGQHVSDAFHVSDFFLDNTQEQMKEGKSNEFWTIPDQLVRLVKIIIHDEIVRPTVEESAMYAAYGAKLRSACLSRQVGAAIMDDSGNVISTGTNEVPCAGGGVYRDKGESRSGPEGRCAFQDENPQCANTGELNKIVDDVIKILIPTAHAIKAEEKLELIKKLKNTDVGRLIEFSRAVHAEMDALLSAARRGIPVVGARAFITTFPCHYCARHLVSAGVNEVQYIEPYPKSKALKLHPDSITKNIEDWKAPTEGGSQVLFRPYTGVAPRMFERAFLKDRSLKNKDTGKLDIGNPEWGTAWDIAKVSYADLELKLIKPLGTVDNHEKDT